MADHVPLTADEFAALMADVSLQVDDAMAVAVSGGADSMALLCLLHRWGAKPIVLTYDHGLRAEAAEEAAQVAQWCKAMGLVHHILKWDAPAGEKDVQQGAREARYHDLEGFCREKNIGHLLLAHHQDDQAETVLMRLVRGSGVNGLAAMKKRSDPLSVGKTPILCRPLLDVPRGRLLATLADMNQSWIEDPSNRSERFMRVRLRQFMDQFGDDGLTVRRLADTAKRMGRVRDYFDHILHQWLKANAILHETGFLELDMHSFQQNHQEVRWRLLARCLQTISGHVHPPEYDAVQRVDASIAADGFSGLTSFGCALWQNETSLIIAREVAAIGEGHIGEDGDCYWDGRYHIKRKGGTGALHIGPLQEQGWIALLDARPELRGMALPHMVRQSLPCFRRGENIIAVPHLAYAIEGAGNISLRLSPRRLIF